MKIKDEIHFIIILPSPHEQNPETNRSKEQPVETKTSSLVVSVASTDNGLLADLRRLQKLLDDSPELCHVFEQVISPAEIRAFKRRVGLLLKTGSFPEWYPGHNVPYPPI